MLRCVYRMLRPTAGVMRLDARYRLEMLALVRSLKFSTLAALHDLNLAAAYCDRLYLQLEFF